MITVCRLHITGHLYLIKIRLCFFKYNDYITSVFIFLAKVFTVLLADSNYYEIIFLKPNISSLNKLRMSAFVPT